MRRTYLIDVLINERGALDAGTLGLWLGSDGFCLTSQELAELLNLSRRTVEIWRCEAGPRPRHLRARLIEAELILRRQGRQPAAMRRAIPRPRRRTGASPAPA